MTWFFIHDVVLAAHLRARQRFGSGDGERKTLLTRQKPYEPLPASVLFGPLSDDAVFMVSRLPFANRKSATKAKDSRLSLYLPEGFVRLPLAMERRYK